MTNAAATAKSRIGKVGIWSLELRFGDPGEAVEAAAELDELGYGALWVPGGIGGPVLDDIGRLLAATKRATIATGILNIWKHEPSEVAEWWTAQSDAIRERTLLGLGISHAPLIGDAYAKPVATMRAYLDMLEEAGMALDRAVLAALGPKMLELSATRTLGAHPYLVTPEHTAIAREVLGPDALLAPEQGVVFETDPTRARELARGAVAHYRSLPNYTNNWKRLGFSNEEIEAASDRLIDALFAWGPAERIAERIAAHHAAGADHVCIQVINGAEGPSAAASLPAWRALAEVLL
jgi:probable F420-dependent oxidoreductase